MSFRVLWLGMVFLGACAQSPNPLSAQPPSARELFSAARTALIEAGCVISNGKEGDKLRISIRCNGPAGFAGFPKPESPLFDPQAGRTVAAWIEHRTKQIRAMDLYIQRAQAWSGHDSHELEVVEKGKAQFTKHAKEVAEYQADWEKAARASLAKVHTLYGKVAPLVRRQSQILEELDKAGVQFNDTGTLKALTTNTGPEKVVALCGEYLRLAKQFDEVDLDLTAAFVVYSLAKENKALDQEIPKDFAKLVEMLESLALKKDDLSDVANHWMTINRRRAVSLDIAEWQITHDGAFRMYLSAYARLHQLGAWPVEMGSALVGDPKQLQKAERVVTTELYIAARFAAQGARGLLQGRQVPEISAFAELFQRERLQSVQAFFEALCAAIKSAKAPDLLEVYAEASQLSKVMEPLLKHGEGEGRKDLLLLAYRWNEAGFSGQTGIADELIAREVGDLREENAKRDFTPRGNDSLLEMGTAIWEELKRGVDAQPEQEEIYPNVFVPVVRDA
ncbi:hypothetical protein K2X33_09830 [bacterium]|nr:hypothetical protein [bacterium]